MPLGYAVDLRSVVAHAATTAPDTMATVKSNQRLWYPAFEAVEPYVVKVITTQGTGTGFLITSVKKPNLIGIATAAHVVQFAHYWKQPIQIEHAKSGKTIFLNEADRVITVNYERDTASIVLQRDETPFPANSLPLIPENKHLKVGVEVGWMGFPAIAPSNLCFFSGSVSCWVENEGYYFVDGVAINGVSGGPTFQVAEDNSVWIIGLVSAYVPNLATGTAMPGLCVVRDIFPLYGVIKGLKSLEEAKQKETPSESPPPPPSGPAGNEPTRG
jgi:hypothetical protein